MTSYFDVNINDTIMFSDTLVSRKKSVGNIIILACNPPSDIAIASVDIFNTVP